MVKKIKKKFIKSEINKCIDLGITYWYPAIMKKENVEIRTIIKNNMLQSPESIMLDKVNWI